MGRKRFLSEYDKASIAIKQVYWDGDEEIIGVLRMLNCSLKMKHAALNVMDVLDLANDLDFPGTFKYRNSPEIFYFEEND